jgi:6-pyruvoyl-tetrahydropterin synthase
MMLVGARSYFCAGHKLPQHESVHGHSYEVWAYRKPPCDAEALQTELTLVCGDFDHKMLNDILDPPTMENIAKLVAKMMGAAMVRVIRPVEGLSAEFTAFLADK